MSLLKSILRFVAEYFVFIGGFLFIFVIGAMYAFIRPESLAVNSIFLIIAIGWVIFLIKYFWDVLEKKKRE